MRLFQRLRYYPKERLQKMVVIFTMASLFCLGMRGQVVMERGAGDPTKFNVSKWYFDTLDHRVWLRTNNNWNTTRQGYIVKIVHCRELLAFFNGDEWKVYATSSGQYLTYANAGFECLEGMARVEWTVSNRFYVDTAYVAWNWSMDNTHHPSRLKPPDTLNGMPAYCASVFVSQLKPNNMDAALHGWGMLGYSGKWLVEPIFDEPFHFKNGTAEVLYYGVKRKINEKGEFVE